MKHIVALSGGKDSTALALRLSEVEPQDYEYVCTPTGRELPPMLEHWDNLGRLLGKRITPVRAKNTLAGLVYLQKALPNYRMRWCTRMLKIEPFEQYIMVNRPCTVYVGIRADEIDDRDGVKWEQIDGVTRRYPLLEWNWGIGDVRNYLKLRGVTIPDRTDCDMCFFQRLYEWYVFWRDYPERWAQIEAWEEFTGHTLRSDQRDSKPASLKGLRAHFEAGYVPKQRTTMKDRKTMCTVCAR